MENLMKAIVLADGNLEVQNVNKPQHAPAGHLIIKMHSSAINSGDKFFLKNPTPPGTVKSLYDIKGVSGVGLVAEIGDAVPREYLGKNVTVYRQLKYSESAIGMWSEYAQVHYLDCVILPDNVEAADYAGSVVNAITPFAFYQQIVGEGHEGIISTAGNSATGIALLGICLTYNFPLISIVRNEAGKKELQELGAKNIIVQSNDDFTEQLKQLAQQLKATAVFEGVGGETLNKIISSLPYSSVVYSYGYIGDQVPLTVNMSTFALKNLTIRSFSNYKTDTVQNPENLEKAMKELGKLIHMPHFKTKIGQRFKLEEINEAIAFGVVNGKKAILYHG